MATRKKTQRTKIALSLLQAFNGLSAIVGGWALVGDPTGFNLGMDLAWLESTPFSDFLIPGLILLIVNGLGNAAGFFATVREYRWAGDAGLVLGAIMMIWIMTQVVMIGYQSLLQPIYLLTGLFQTIMGYLFRTQLKGVIL